MRKPPEVQAVLAKSVKNKYKSNKVFAVFCEEKEDAISMLFQENQMGEGGNFQLYRKFDIFIKKAIMRGGF